MGDRRSALGPAQGAIDSLSRVVFSRYFTSGLISATGTVVLGFAGYALGGMGAALSLGSGALMVSFADNPAPVGLKAVELLFASIAGTLCFAAVWASVAHPWVQLAVVPLLGFLAGLVSLWGKRAVAVAFCLLFITIITMGIPAPRSPGDLAAGTALLLAGALAYTGYALLIGRWLRTRVKQQALAELIDGMAAYARWQGSMYLRQAARPAVPGEGDAYAQAAALQGAVNDALQSARDLVLREGHGPRDALWTHMLLVALDLFETQLAAQIDAAPLRETFDGSDVLDALGQGMQRSADMLGALALALLHDRDTSERAPRPERWDAVQQLADAWLGPRHDPDLLDARAQLGAQLQTLRQADRLIGALDQAYAMRHAPPATPAVPEVPDVRLFVSAWKYDPKQVLSHLRLGSPIFRHAVRLALALAVSLLVSRLLFSHQTHDYWIALTIAVILRPNYGVTRQRIRDRLFGTIAGCVLVALFLALNPGLDWLLLALFLAMALARTFVTTHYRFTAMAGSALALLLAHLLQENTHILVLQRLLDTAIGAALAWAASHVLPRWEYMDAPRQLRELLSALSRYAQAVLAQQAHQEREFRVARKQLFDSLAGMTGLYGRMLEEPQAQRRAPQELAGIITHAYLLASQLVSLRLLRAQLQPQGRIDAQALQWIELCRERVLRRLAPAASAEPGPPEEWLASDDPLLSRLARIGLEAARIGQIRQRLQREMRAAEAQARGAGPGRA
ncbi:MAG: FUSC family protein [Betaproteobacteria bacterium]|nr:FUSC family protein [Betaproteobacteria bacterium]MBU6511643.1 FUSC family protein [Betaproteobacteria bacterium]